MLRERASGRSRAIASRSLRPGGLQALYRATVAQADAWLVGPLLDLVEREDLTGETVVVLVADHGDEFLEHGSMGHTGRPCTGSWHGSPGSWPDPRVNGRDVLADRAPRAPFLMHLGIGWDGLVEGPWKLVRRPAPAEGPVVELYRFDEDPLDRTDLAVTRPDEVNELLDRLDRMKARASAMGEKLAQDAGDAGAEVAADLARKLDGLGYAGK